VDLGLRKIRFLALPEGGATMVSPGTGEEVLRKRLQEETTGIAETTTGAVRVINYVEEMLFETGLTAGNSTFRACNWCSLDASKGL
jgi:hypothetical protein